MKPYTRITAVGALFVTLTLLNGCGNSAKIAPAFIQAHKEPFEIVIPAFGELEAVTSTPIAMPPQTRGQQTIAWLAPENSMVKAGEAVIRFDSSRYQERIATEEWQIKKLDLEIAIKDKEVDQAKLTLQGDIDITAIEKKLAELYGAKDTSIYSTNEIIEASIDLGYLKIKETHFQGKKKKLEQKSLTELQLLQLKKNTHQVKLKQYQDILLAMEIKAPHDGLFIYERTWNGTKPSVGMGVWSGMKLGKLPDLSSMKAKVYVLESEAAGLKKDLAVTCTLNAAPQLPFSGKITAMDTIAKPLDRESSLKYFQIQVNLDKTDPLIMKPGSQVTAAIFVHKQADAIAVPNQALFLEKEKYYVNIKKSSASEKREVEIGARSLTRTVITKGVDEGESIYLGSMQQKEESQ